MATVADKALDKTSDLISMAADKAGDVFQAASNLISKGVALYGQQAIDAVLWVVRIDAIQQLLFAWLIVIASITILYLFNFSKTKLNLWSYWNWSEGFMIFPIGFSYIILIPALFISLNTITNVWLYTAIIKPELYLVKKTVDAVEKKLGTSVTPGSENSCKCNK